MSRIEQAISKYSSIPKKTIKTIAKADLSGNHKYLDWMLSNYQEDKISEIVNLTKQFHDKHQRLENKDIYSYSFEDLKNALSNLSESKRSQEKEKFGSIRTIYEDEYWKIVRPEYFVDMQKLTPGTRWCISDSMHYYFNIQKGLFYVAQLKSKATDLELNDFTRFLLEFFGIDFKDQAQHVFGKIAIHVNHKRYTMYSANDQVIHDRYKKKLFGSDEIKAIIKADFEKHPKTQEQEILAGNLKVKEVFYLKNKMPKDYYHYISLIKSKDTLLNIFNSADDEQKLNYLRNISKKSDFNFIISKAPQQFIEKNRILIINIANLKGSTFLHNSSKKILGIKIKKSLRGKRLTQIEKIKDCNIDFDDRFKAISWLLDQENSSIRDSIIKDIAKTIEKKLTEV